MADENSSYIVRCPQCGMELNPKIAEGNCPNCLMQQAAHGTGTDDESGRRWQPPSIEAIQASFPQLDVIDLVGSGGMGAVYKAKQKSLGRFVALKVLAPHYADNPNFAERFAREAKVLAEVTHPHIVAVHDFGFAKPFYYLLMEFVDGVNLRQAMNAARLTPEQALQIVPPICEALQFAHQRGIVHRDIKPENLLLDKFGQIKIVDFGIARLLGSHPESKPSGSQSEAPWSRDVTTDSTDRQLTGVSVIGTPNYMAPEQRVNPQHVDHRADIYSLGVVLYEMLTGELPGAKLTPPSQRVQVDVRLDEVVLRALDSKPELRYSTAFEFQQSVESVATSIPHSNRIAPVKSQFPIHFSKCHITNRQELETAFGQLFLWRKNGYVQLGDSQIQFIRDASTTTIPLEAIRSVSLGLLSAAANPYGLNFIDIEYQSNGDTKSLVFIPNERIVDYPSSFNVRIYNWWESIRQHVESRTGKVPIARPAKDLLSRSAKNSAWWVLVLFALILTSIFLFTQLAIRQVDGGGSVGWWGWIGAVVFAAFILSPTLVLLRLRNRNDPDHPRFHKRIALLRSHTSSDKMSRLAVTGLIAFPFVVGGLVGVVFQLLLWRSAANANLRPPILVAPIDPIFPSAAHVGGKGTSESGTVYYCTVYYSTTRGYLDFVIVYKGEFGSSSGGSQNPMNGTWNQDARLLLKNDRTFQVTRSFMDEQKITINGSEKRLSSGRVFQLGDDGTFQQIAGDPPIDVAMNPSSILKWIESAKEETIRLERL